MASSSPSGRATKVSPITRGYTLQRYVQACGGRGELSDQVQRQHLHRRAEADGHAVQPRLAQLGRLPLVAERPHIYHPMLAAGDFEMMKPLFRLYEAVRPLCEARAKIYHGCGAAISPRR